MSIEWKKLAEPFGESARLEGEVKRNLAGLETGCRSRPSKIIRA